MNEIEADQQGMRRQHACNIDTHKHMHTHTQTGTGAHMLL